MLDYNQRVFKKYQIQKLRLHKWTWTRKIIKLNIQGKKADFGVSSMVSTLKTVGMLKPMEALKRADPNKWHYGQAFDPSKIESNYSSFIKILNELGCRNLMDDAEKQ